MSKKTNIQDFLKFVRDNPNLSRTSTIKEFRNQGGHIQKQKALDVFRELFGIEKGTSRGLTFQSVLNEKEKILKTQSTKTAYINILSETSYQKDHPLTSRIHKNAKKLYDGKINFGKEKTLEVPVNIVGDEYLHDKYKNFRIFIADNGRNKKGVKSFINSLLDNMQTYFSNLNKMYRDKNVFDETHFKSIKKEINKIKYLTENQARIVLKTYGITLGEVARITWE